MNHLRPALIVLLFTTVVAPFANSQVVKFRDEVDAIEASSQPAEVDPTDQVSGTVKLNLRGNVELKALVEYIGRRLGISFVYDDEIAGKRVNVRAPEEVPVRSLMEILGSVLKMEGMILVEADTPGWLRIVSASEMARLSSPDGDGPLRNPATPITQMFSLENAKPQTLISLLDPFLTGPDSNVFGIEETGTLVVTDYPSVVENVGLLIRMLDKGRGETKIRYYRVQHASVDTLVEKVQEALNSTSAKLIGLTDTQVVAVVGVQPQLDQAVEFLERFDVPVDRTVKVHRFKNIRAERVQAILEGMLDGETWARYTVTADRDANLLVVRAASDVHTLFDDIIQQLDQPTENPATPLRFYKLRNAKAIEVFFTLQTLQQTTGVGAGFGGYGGGYANGAAGLSQFGAGTAGLNPYAAGGFGGGGIYGIPNAGLGGGFGGGFGAGNLGGGGLGIPGAGGTNPLSTGNFGSPGFGSGTINAPGNFTTTTLPLGATSDDALTSQDNSRQRVGQLSTAALSGGGASSLPGGARVSIDIASNSLIVVAPNEVHRMYEQIIKKLDVRRPQVLIEAHIVAVDTSDRFQLGVEVSGGDRVGDRRLFKFTSFGLSEVDPATGQLTLNPGLGFNGALVDPDVADVILQALVTHTRAHVLSSPQLLVNDNSTGQLESTASVPFQSVNASNTVSTTSLGGNQDAGTKLTVTPQINEGSHLQLDFALEFSTFDGESSDVSLPPPRQIDRVTSQVTIPNGHTVIVGGLNREGAQDAFTGVPWLEHIPVIRELTSLRSEQDDSTSFFLFIRPNILRDERFRDLKHFSQRSLRTTGAKGDYPESRPIMMK